MFNEEEAQQLAGRLKLILEKGKAGRVDMRDALAEQLVEAAREYLAGRYNTNLMKDLKPDGIHQTRDSLTKDDFKRS